MRVVGLRQREGGVQPAHVGAGALGHLRRLIRVPRQRVRLAVPRVGVVVRAAGDVDHHEDGLRLLPHHVLDVLRVRRIRGSYAFACEITCIGCWPERPARVREEDRADEARFASGLATARADCRSSGCRTSARHLLRLRAVAPLVVAGRVDQRLGSNAVHRLKIDWSYAAGAGLAARVDVADGRLSARYSTRRPQRDGIRLPKRPSFSRFGPAVKMMVFVSPPAFPLPTVRLHSPSITIV